MLCYVMSTPEQSDMTAAITFIVLKEPYNMKQLCKINNQLLQAHEYP